MPCWIDTHAHLDALVVPEARPGKAAEAAFFVPFVTPFDMHHALRALNVQAVVIPAVGVANFAAVRALAHASGQFYALGLHPLSLLERSDAQCDEDLYTLSQWLQRCADDPRLVAVGEIGLDFFVPALCAEPMRQRQERVYAAQLELARRHRLPVLLHVRRSADRLLKHLRALWRHAPAGRPPEGCAGIAHAFSGSAEQARAFLDLGFVLGFGGTATFEAARRIRALAASLPATAIVMETDAPDIPPQWLYTPAAERQAGQPQGVNTPLELPRIGAVVAGLRGVSPEEWAAQTTANACAALPRLAAALGPAPCTATAPSHRPTP